jgi:hypothetical protein
MTAANTIRTFLAALVLALAGCAYGGYGGYGPGPDPFIVGGDYYGPLGGFGGWDRGYRVGPFNGDRAFRGDAGRGGHGFRGPAGARNIPGPAGFHGGGPRGGRGGGGHGR